MDICKTYEETLTNLINVPFGSVDGVDVPLLLDSNSAENGVIQRGTAVDYLTGNVQSISSVHLRSRIICRDVQAALI